MGNGIKEYTVWEDLGIESEAEVYMQETLNYI